MKVSPFLYIFWSTGVGAAFGTFAALLFHINKRHPISTKLVYVVQFWESGSYMYGILPTIAIFTDYKEAETFCQIHDGKITYGMTK